jgi:molybdopterin synthase sulfur carrier subunit
MINILFFGELKDKLSSTGIELAVESDITVSKLRLEICQKHPQWTDHISAENVLVAVDQVMAKSDTCVPKFSEVAFFPPVTGG